MPRGDGTGPTGAGPMTGRGAGFCRGAKFLGQAAVGAGLCWGLSRGLGLGFGRGRGMGFAFSQRSGETQKELLERQKELLENQVKALDEQLESL